jgi:hypothetical protein
MGMPLAIAWLACECRIQCVLAFAKRSAPFEESAQTGSTLTGSDKHWGNTEPGELFQRIVVGGEIANPLVVLDELEKATKGGQGMLGATASGQYLMDFELAGRGGKVTFLNWSPSATPALSPAAHLKQGLHVEANDEPALRNDGRSRWIRLSRTLTWILGRCCAKHASAGPP